MHVLPSRLFRDASPTCLDTQEQLKTEKTQLSAEIERLNEAFILELYDLNELEFKQKHLQGNWEDKSKAALIRAKAHFKILEKNIYFFNLKYESFLNKLDYWKWLT